jgi:uncharacterized membrane protein
MMILCVAYEKTANCVELYPESENISLKLILTSTEIHMIKNKKNAFRFLLVLRKTEEKSMVIYYTHFLIYLSLFLWIISKTV